MTGHSDGKEPINSRLLSVLRSILPSSRIKTSLADRLAFSSDASIYSLIPSLVLFPENSTQLRLLIQTANQFNAHYTFRTAGTSLSGQAVTDGWLILLTRGWNSCLVDEGGTLVTVEPGITGEKVNRALKPFHRKLGPDPASIHAAMMGGILANNASGMCCGVADNAYHSLVSLKAVLPDGSLFDSRLPLDNPSIENELLSIRETIRSNTELKEKIRSAFQIKNTLGYSLNAFLDFDNPADILARLFIGSEGTLGAITSATLRTIPDPANRITALFLVPDLKDATDLTSTIQLTQPLAIELMDGECIRVFRNSPYSWSQQLKQADRKSAVLLVEWDADSPTFRLQSLDELPFHPLAISSDEKERLFIWNLRKGLFPSVGAARQAGTSVIIEDVAVPSENFGHLAIRLRKLLDEYGFQDAVIFGHARDGNLHFVISQDFTNGDVVSRYRLFINDLVRLVISLKGSLKAEHGTGRNMAPFLETAWGTEAVAIMQQVKNLIDPKNLCNPGIILNPDNEIHLKHLKSIPMVDPDMDACIECGFCEPECPSKNYTLTPRQRLVLLRAEKIYPQWEQEINKQFQFSGTDSCATDSLCSLNCPVGIDTGKEIKKIRSKQNGLVASFTAGFIKSNFRGVEELVRMASPLKSWSGVRFYGGKTEKLLVSVAPQAIWFQTCISRTLGGFPDGSTLSGLIRDVLEKHKIHVTTPESNGFCCGMPFFSKGFIKKGTQSWVKLIDHLYNESLDGQLPVLVDNSPCALTLNTLPPDIPEDTRQKHGQLQILDSPVFIEKFILLKISQPEKKRRVWIHAPCSVHKSGEIQSLKSVVHHISEPINSFDEPSCCGMAGDRGILYPGLMHSALEDMKEILDEKDPDMIVSTSLTCGSGISSHINQPVLSLWQLFCGDKN